MYRVDTLGHIAEQRRMLMKTTILAVAAVFSLGVGAAFAQGTAGAQPPVYGQAWAANQRAEAIANASRAQNAAANRAPASAQRSASSSSARAD
jgi:hypothetical protein